MPVKPSSNKSSLLRMPVIFIGHGSPMNAIADNQYTKMLQALGKRLPRPKAIIVISAHWLTQGTHVTESLYPKTIHDFGGFPKPLFEIQYPAPGSLKVVKLLQQVVPVPQIRGDNEQWGFDHGAWSVLRHLYPKADIPVLQLSIDIGQPSKFHFDLGQKIAQFRNQDILIIGSGNVLHNLRQLRSESNAQSFGWALEYDKWIKQKLETKDFQALIYDFHQTDADKRSVPSMDHYFPMLYVLGAVTEDDRIKIEYEEIQNGSISMLSFSFSS